MRIFSQEVFLAPEKERMPGDSFPLWLILLFVGVEVVMGIISGMSPLEETLLILLGLVGIFLLIYFWAMADLKK
jgi:hypothetical protein